MLRPWFGSRLAVALAAVAMTASACSSPSTGNQPTDAGLQVQFSCGGHPFGPELFGEPEADLSTFPAGQALAAFIESGMDGDIVPDEGWHLAGQDPTTASFVAAVDGDPPFAEAQAELRDGQWEIVGWGQCRPTLDVAGRNRATWMLAEGVTVGPSTTSFAVDVTEIDCASGRPSDDRLLDPIIAYLPREVLVIFTVTPPPGEEQECPGNPSTRQIVELREPLGNRTLWDAAVLPYHDPTEDWPPP